jgi:hypothetical protein
MLNDIDRLHYGRVAVGAGSEVATGPELAKGLDSNLLLAALRPHAAKAIRVIGVGDGQEFPAPEASARVNDFHSLGNGFIGLCKHDKPTGQGGRGRDLAPGHTETLKIEFVVIADDGEATVIIFAIVILPGQEQHPQFAGVLPRFGSEEVKRKPGAVGE